MVILQCLLGCFLLGTLKIDTAQVALAYVVLLYKVAELLVKELANDAIIGDVACLIAKLQALKLALGTLQLSKKLGWSEASACSGLGARVWLGQRALSLDKLLLRASQLHLNLAQFLSLSC